MTESLLPAVVGPPSPGEWAAMKEQAAVIASSGLAPAGVNNANQILVIAMKGRELAIPPMQALAHVHVINGKPAMSSELMGALVHRAGHKLRILETTDQTCTVEGVRADDPDVPQKFTHTIAMAQASGDAGKGTWKKHPGAMLRARAISTCCRAMFQDVLMGVSYTPDELEDVSRTAEHDALLEQVEIHVAEAVQAGVQGDYDALRRHAQSSESAAVAALQRLAERIQAAAEVVEAEVVEGDAA